MKKQTKVMATLSTAALLALGFSAVSMAAGWDNSTGVWRYLNNDGTEVVDEWKSANGNWFYLDSDGVMATDKLIEDESGSKTKYYYVDQYGAMVKNTWKAVAMDDDDNTDRKNHGFQCAPGNHKPDSCRNEQHRHNLNQKSAGFIHRTERKYAGL